MLAAMHRVMHLPAHEIIVSNAAHDVKHTHPRADADRSQMPAEVSGVSTFDFLADHHTKVDCDRFDACAAGDIVLAQLNEAQLDTYEIARPTRIDVAYVAARALRATARAPPATA